MELIWLLIPLIFCIEIAKKISLGKSLDLFLGILVKIRHIISYNKASDRWKEKALLRYALRLFNLNFQLLIHLVLTFLPFIIVLLIDKIFDSELSKALFDIYFYLVSIPAVFAYIKLRSAFHDRW